MRVRRRALATRQRLDSVVEWMVRRRRLVPIKKSIRHLSHLLWSRLLVHGMDLVVIS
jgi:hypothetical protein